MSEPERKKIEQLIEKRHKVVQKEKEDENLHTEMQYHLLKIGNALGFDVIAASNDRSRNFHGQSFSFISLKNFPNHYSRKRGIKYYSADICALI